MGGPVRVLHAMVNMNRGGAETLIMNLYRQMNRSLVQFDFLTSKEGEFDQEIVRLGGRIHRVPYVTEVGHLNYLKALDQFFSSHRSYQIVHAHMDKMSGWILRSAKKHGIPVRIAHSHNTSSEGGPAARAYKWVAGKHILQCATHTLACSKAAADWLFHRNHRAILLKNGIDIQQFAFSEQTREKTRRALNISEKKFVMGHVGRFNAQKNHHFLIQVFAQFHQQHPNSVLVLIGDGPLRPEITRKVHDLKLENNVHFLGVRKDIASLLHAFDVFVFPSHFEGLPVALVEAQGSGLPCLVSDVVSEEVDLGLELIKFLSLRDTGAWVEALQGTAGKGSSRHCDLDVFVTNGFEITETAKWLERYYLTLCRGERHEDTNRVYANV